MPNIKSAIKRVNIIEKKTLQNNMVKSAYKTAVKTFEAAVAEGDKTKAEAAFKNAVKMKDVAREVPIDKLVLETDSPYLTPVPFRGKQNKPAYVKYVAEEIAKLRGMSIEELIDVTTGNAERFFGI